MRMPSSILKMLGTVAASNNHNRDLSFLCYGISLAYHQSILTFHSPFLTNMLGSLTCCKCEKAQCGRKEEMVIMLDKVEVGTVQGLMEYLYKGECIVKDKKGLREMQELINMLGIETKLEFENNFVNDGDVVAGAETRKPDLEETVSDFSPEVTVSMDELAEAEDILRFCESDVDQKCSKSDEWLNKDNFMEHFKQHREDDQRSVAMQQKQLSDPNLVQKASEDDSSESIVEANTSLLSEQVVSCMEEFEKGEKEITCAECGEGIVKEGLMEHFKNHVDSIQDVSFDSSSVNAEIKERGPEKRTSNVVSENQDKFGKPSTKSPIEEDSKQSADTKIGLSTSKLKSKGRKKKSDTVLTNLAEHGIAEEYTCFIPTFKIKPGSKRVQSSPVVPVPEIKLTFNLNDLGIAQETIKLQDLSSVPKVKRKRKAGLKGLDSEVTGEAKGSWVKKKGKRCKVPKVGEKERKLNKILADSSSTAAVSTFVLPSSRVCASFPTFLSGVCRQAEKVLPLGLDKEQEELGRRVVHRLAGQRVGETGHDGLVTQEDVIKEMIDGLQDDNFNNVSSDGSEAPLVMDLPEQDV